MLSKGDNLAGEKPGKVTQALATEGEMDLSLVLGAGALQWLGEVNTPSKATSGMWLMVRQVLGVRG